MINFFNYLLVSNIFTGAFFVPTKYFQFYLGYVFMLVFLIYVTLGLKKLRLHKGFLLILTGFFAVSAIHVCLGNNSPAQLIKQMLGFILNGVVYFNLIKINEEKIERLFDAYLRLAVIVALIGLFQEFSYLVHFKEGYDFSLWNVNIRLERAPGHILRVTSLLQEPAHLGASLMPASFVAIHNFLKSDKKFLNPAEGTVIVVCALLTLSLVVYVGLVIACVLIILNNFQKRMVAICVVLLCLFAFASYRYLPGVKMRINDTLDVITAKKPLDLHKVNVSSYTFYTNGYVALKSFLKNPALGSGIGSHSVSHDRYIPKPKIYLDYDLYLCKDDAGSLFFRLISETGLAGLLLFIYFLIRHYVSRKLDGRAWLISNGILTLVFMNLIRNGNYFYCGFVFFMWLYYFSYKSSRPSNAIPA